MSQCIWQHIAFAHATWLDSINMWCRSITALAMSFLCSCHIITLPQATIKASSCSTAGLTNDLWHTGYKLNEDMRPNFISRQMACTILRAGKSINFLRSVHAFLNI